MLGWVVISFSRESSQTQGPNPHLLHRQVGSLLLNHQGSPVGSQQHSINVSSCYRYIGSPTFIGTSPHFHLIRQHSEFSSSRKPSLNTSHHSWVRSLLRTQVYHTHLTAYCDCLPTAVSSLKTQAMASPLYP